MLILPYTYTHSSLQPVNYLQYTHLGKHLGSVLEPNSDQLSARLFVEPVAGIGFNAWFKRIRHGNASDYGEGSIDGDGSIYDDGYLPGGYITFLDASSFLSQETLETVTQVGVGFDVELHVWELELQLQGGYTLEFVKNRDLDPSVPDETNHLFSVDFRVGI